MTAAGGAISMVVGAVLLRLSLTGTYQRYVKVGMGPWLTLAGLVVVALGLATLVRALRTHGHDDAHAPDHGHDHENDHDHDHGDRVGWLLLAPIAALLLVAPPTLGSYGVDRGAAVDVRAGAPTFDPLPVAASGEPASMTLLEFNQRALDHGGDSFAGQPVQLTGFVADDATPFRLARYQIACCAVDAAPVVVHIAGTVGATPSVDQWVTVTGTFTRLGDDDIPELSATSIVEIPAPEDPYE